jgi:hypothetical protein
MQLKVPGLLFYAEPYVLAAPVGLEPAMSTYQYGFDLEGVPKKNDLYVVCKDQTIQSVHEPDRPIGWELIEKDDQWFYRVTQMNHVLKPCLVRYCGHTDSIPEGRGRIGSFVGFYTTSTQNAQDTQMEDDGEEVSSCPGLLTDSDTEPECPGAPLKMTPMQVANALGDPVQIEALKKFEKGELSYAEMRGLCG